MPERLLRWKGRIGSLKVGCGIMLILAVLVACTGLSGLSTALQNPDTPQKVTLTQLVNGDVTTGCYVRVSGLAAYDLGYEKSADGKPTASYYFLIDRVSGDMVLVKHTTVLSTTRQADDVTLTGMTRLIPTELKNAMKEDETFYADHGLRTTLTLYLEEGAQPPKKGSSILFLVVGLIGIGLCLIPFFFPGMVFAPYPVDTTAAPSTARYGVKATGTFIKLKSVEPLEVAKATRRFSNAVANLVPVGDHELMIYIHYILKTKTYGITISTTITDWGVFLHKDRVDDVTAGKLYGWKDKWAVRFRYPNAKGKTATLYVIFDTAGAQAEFVKLLRAMQFTVVAGG